MTTEEFLSAIDWARVRADVLARRGELESLRSLVGGELRVRSRQPSRREQEQLYRWGDNIRACNSPLTAMSRWVEAAP